MGLEAPSPAWLARIFRQEGVGRGRTVQETEGGVAPVRPAPPPTPAGGSTPPSTSWPAGARAVIWPAPGRPLAPGGGLAGRPGRWPARRPSTSSTRARPPGARTRRPRGRQRRGPGPQPARSHRPPGRGTCAPWASNPPPADPTGPPPTGDNERFGQTLLRHPGRQPLADSIAEPPGDGSTASTTPCNTQRPHQGLPGRITGQQAQDAGEVARAPRPGHGTDPITPGGEPARDAPAGRRPPHRRRPIAPSGEREAGHHPQRHRPHRRHRVPGPPRPGRAPNHRDLGRHHHHLRRRPRRGPDPVQLAARRRHLRLPPPARPHQPTRQAPAAGGPNRHRSPDTPNVTHVLTQNRHPCPETSQFQPSFSKAKCTSRVQNANLDREGTRAGRRVIASGRRGQAGTGRARGRRPAEDCGVGTGPLTRWCAARSGPP